MKKTVRLVALAMVAVVLCLALAACGKTLSGKYSAEALGTGATYEFKGSKVTVTYKALGTEVYSVECKYQIKDDKITFEIADEDEISNELAKKVVAELEKPAAFEEGDNYIKIGDVKYTKQAD